MNALLHQFVNGAVTKAAGSSLAVKVSGFINDQAFWASRVVVEIIQNLFGLVGIELIDYAIAGITAAPCRAKNRSGSIHRDIVAGKNTIWLSELMEYAEFMIRRQSENGTCPFL